MLNPAVVNYVSRIIQNKNAHSRLLQATHYNTVDDCLCKLYTSLHGRTTLGGSKWTPKWSNLHVQNLDDLAYWMGTCKTIVDEPIELSEEELAYIHGVIAVC